MIEFVAGIMVGGSLGAVVVGALLSQARAMTGVRSAAETWARATSQAPRYLASASARHSRPAELPVVLRTGTAFAAFATSSVH